MRRGERERNKTQEKQMIQKTIAHQLTHAQPHPKPQQALASQLPPVHVLGMVSYGMK